MGERYCLLLSGGDTFRMFWPLHILDRCECMEAHAPVPVSFLGLSLLACLFACLLVSLRAVFFALYFSFSL